MSCSIEDNMATDPTRIYAFSLVPTAITGDTLDADTPPVASVLVEDAFFAMHHRNAKYVPPKCPPSALQVPSSRLLPMCAAATADVPSVVGVFAHEGVYVGEKPIFSPTSLMEPPRMTEWCWCSHVSWTHPH